MIALTKRTSVPQIFIGDTHVGGYDDMIALHRAGGLESLLESVA
jgi:glutaredoxin 3